MPAERKQASAEHQMAAAEGVVSFIFFSYIKIYRTLKRPVFPQHTEVNNSQPTDIHQGSENLKVVCANTPVLALNSWFI